MPLSFERPELLLLAVPVALLFAAVGRHRGVTGGLRVVLWTLLLLIAAGPLFATGGRGLDVLVVVDRSNSMPEEAGKRIAESVEILESARGDGDRVGVIGFGRDPAVEQLPSAEADFQRFGLAVDADASDLDAALERAVAIADPDRPTRIVLLSDGEATGIDPTSAARRARGASIPIDVRHFGRPAAGDVAVTAIELPPAVAPREPFRFNVDVVAPTPRPATVVVRRDGREIARRDVTLGPGTNRYTFRDITERPGLLRYDVSVEAGDDPRPENNVGLGVVRVEADPRILLVTADGWGGQVADALRSGRLAVDVVSPKTHPLTRDALEPYAAVILENVRAGDLGRGRMLELKRFVEDLGGGLMLTGGRRSFGAGGYFQSALDEALPVSMELRDEHRRGRVAIAVALDRSGSMSAPVGVGRTKMDLANIGTAECVRLLGPSDSVAIIAVDSAPHVVQPLTPVDAPEAIASKALQIESMGGGIFVYEALVAAGKQLLAAPQATKHIILFSDAADSEVPGDYISLLADYRAAGITVSVIGLGTRSDVDAALLKDIAAKGDGSIAFTENAEELPRLFTEDTLSVARGTFVEADPATQPGGIGGDVLPGVVTLGPADASLLGTAPPVGGYNLTYLRPGATPSARSRDEYAAPWAAHWYRGLGRAAAITVELDGPFTGAFDDWDDYAAFLVAHARWLIDRGDADGLFVDVARAGQDGVVTIELDRPADRPPEVLVVPPGGQPGEVVRPELRWDGPSTLTARFPLKSAGAYRTVVRSEGGAVVRGPVVSLPYSTELAPRTGRRGGLETLRELASSTGGVERFDLRTVFEDLPRTAATVSLTPPLLIATLVLLVVEIAGRRLDLWRLLATRLGRFTTATRTGAARRPADAETLRTRTASPRPARAAIPTEATPPRDAAPPKPAAATRETGPSVFEKAKRKAAGRTGGP